MSPLTPEELQARVEAGGPVRNVLLAGGDYRGLALANARFENVRARAARFDGCQFDSIHWQACDLDGAVMTGATLTDVDFRQCKGERIAFGEASLMRVYAHECAWPGADFNAASVGRLRFAAGVLAGVNWTRARLERALFQQTDLRAQIAADAVFGRALMFGCTAPGSNFRATQFIHSSFSRSTLSASCFDATTGHALSFMGCELDGSSFVGARLGSAMFDSATLGSISFRHAMLAGARFFRARATGADFDHADLSRADLSHAAFDVVDFAHANLQQACLHGARFGTARWDSANLAQVRGDDPERLEAERWRAPPRKNFQQGEAS